MVLLLGVTWSTLAQVVKNRSLTREIHFDTGSARIDSSQLHKIQDICAEISGRDNYRVRLKGNTDSVGSYGTNLELSLRRASGVKKKLNECGAVDSLFDTRGLSYTDPRSTNATEEGKAKNRRTVISLTVFYFPVSGLEPVGRLRPGATLDLNILFNFNSAEMRKSSNENLEQVIAIMLAHPDLEFEILGWTAIGQTQDDLSGKRAKAVFDLFLERGIPADRMTYKGMGGAGCSDSKMLEKCRRVEIAIKRNPYLKASDRVRK